MKVSAKIVHLMIVSTLIQSNHAFNPIRRLLRVRRREETGKTLPFITEMVHTNSPIRNLLEDIGDEDDFFRVSYSYSLSYSYSFSYSYQFSYHYDHYKSNSPSASHNSQKSLFSSSPTPSKQEDDENQGVNKRGRMGNGGNVGNVVLDQLSSMAQTCISNTDWKDSIRSFAVQYVVQIQFMRTMDEPRMRAKAFQSSFLQQLSPLILDCTKKNIVALDSTDMEFTPGCMGENNSLDEEKEGACANMKGKVALFTFGEITDEVKLGVQSTVEKVLNGTILRNFSIASWNVTEMEVEPQVDMEMEMEMEMPMNLSTPDATFGEDMSLFNQSTTLSSSLELDKNEKASSFQIWAIWIMLMTATTALVVLLFWMKSTMGR